MTTPPRLNKHLSIHCHTSGMTFNGTDITENHQPLTISLAVLEDLDSLKIIDFLDVKIALQEHMIHDVSLERIHGIGEEAARSGLSFADAAEVIGTFLITHFGIDESIMLFGYNVATFHLPFMQKILHSEGLEFKFDSRSIDLYSVCSLINRFTMYDAVKFLLGEQQPPFTSNQFIKNYIKIYKMLKFLLLEQINNL
jgi:hypothetical protein